MFAILRKKYPSAFPAATRYRRIMIGGFVVAAIAAVLWLCLPGCAMVGTTLESPTGWKYTEGGVVLWKGDLVDLSGKATLGKDGQIERTSKSATTDATAIASLIEKIFQMSFDAGKAAASGGALP